MVWGHGAFHQHLCLTDGASSYKTNTSSALLHSKQLWRQRTSASAAAAAPVAAASAAKVAAAAPATACTVTAFSEAHRRQSLPLCYITETYLSKLIYIAASLAAEALMCGSFHGNTLVAQHVRGTLCWTDEQDSL